MVKIVPKLTLTVETQISRTKTLQQTCPLRHDFAYLRTLEGPDFGLESWSWCGCSHWSLIHYWLKFWLNLFILKVQGTCRSLKSWFGALEHSQGYWLGIWILIFIWIWLLIFDTHLIQFFLLYLDFEGAKTLCPLSPDLGPRRTGVWGLDLDLDFVTGLW